MDALKTTKPDPLLVASLQAEEKGHRRRWRGLTLAVLMLLLLTVAGVAAMLPTLYLPLDLARNRADDEEARDLVTKGQRYLWRVQLDKAEANFRRALKLAPHLPDVWAGLASNHLYYHQYEKAEGLLRKALALDPHYQPALHSLGEIALGAGRQDEAEALWRRCANKTDLGRLYLVQGRFPEAARVLADESRKNPKSVVLRKMTDAARSGLLPPDVRTLLIPRLPASRSPFTAQGWWLLLKRERPGEAIPVFAKALAEDPGNVSALTGQGWALVKAGRMGECRPYFARVLSVWPEDPYALNGMASCLLGSGRIEGALVVWEKMDSLAPVPTSATRHLAWTYYERKDCQQAAHYLAKLLKRYPEEPGATNALEDCLQRLGRGPAPQTRP